jgi:2-oxoglutarate dehydrogenase complex dehydrogenase (E1) component-like enzyme
MYENNSITDGIYGGLSDSDVNEQLNSVTENQIPDDKDSLMDSTAKRSICKIYCPKVGRDCQKIHKKATK